MRHHLIIGNRTMRSGAFVASLLAATNGVGAPAWVQPDRTQREEALPVLRVQLDTQRNRSWVLNHDAVYVYDAAKRRLIQRIELPGWFYVNEVFSCTPDFVLTPTGAALVTSNIVPTIWEIDPKSFVAHQHRLALDVDNDKDVGFVGLAYSRDGKELFGVSSLPGSLWKIDLITDTAQRVQVPGLNPDTCGSIGLDVKLQARV